MIHQYKLFDYNIVLDIASNSIHLVDDVAYDIIALFENNDKEKVVLDIYNKHKNQVSLDIAVHIGMHPVVKDGLSSNNITMSDKFTWHGNFSQRVEKPVTAAVAE